MRKIAIAAVTTALTGLGLLVPATAGAATSSAARPAAAAARSCDVHWGSRSKHAGAMVQAKVRSARAGRHACFDRLVIDIGAGARPGYRVRYVHRIIADGSGDVIKVRGHAIVQQQPFRTRPLHRLAAIAPGPVPRAMRPTKRAIQRHDCICTLGFQDNAALLALRNA